MEDIKVILLLKGISQKAVANNLKKMQYRNNCSEEYNARTKECCFYYTFHSAVAVLEKMLRTVDKL